MILVAIPVHQRGDLVRHCFATAAELELPPGAEIIVFDDASPTLDVAGLIAMSHLACSLERSATRRGADGMVAHIWERFLTGSHRHLFFLDSDMIANRDALTVGLGLTRNFNGLLTLYNSSRHAGETLDGELIGKRVIGNAGTWWNRDLARLALARVGGQAVVDHRYSQLFASLNIPIASTARSRVQHIGISGTNNQYFGNLEHGLGFVPDGLAQWQAIGFVYDELMRNQPSYSRPARAARPSLGQRLGRLVRRRHR